jgi:hypothetical protein
MSILRYNLDICLERLAVSRTNLSLNDLFMARMPFQM